MDTESEDDFASELLRWNYSIADHHYQPDAGTAALWHAVREGTFPENFADHEIASGAAAQLGVKRPWLLRLGDDLFKARSGNYNKAITNLQRIVRRLVKECGQGKPNHRAACYYVTWVCSIRDELQRRQEGQSTGGPHAYTFGIVIGALNYMRERGIKPTFPALCEITKKLACANATETQSAIFHYCREVPLEGWLKPPVNAGGHCEPPS
jgi:hypothetical protein